MSATGRGERLDNTGNDYYGSPAWTVHRLLEKWNPPQGFHWVEPGAGKGNIIRAVNEKQLYIQWTAIERDKELISDLEKTTHPNNIFNSDYFDLSGHSDGVSVVIGNPPYNQAMEFILQSRKLYPNAMICFLLRINFLASEDRHEFIQANTPDIYVLPNRPPFRKNKKGKWATDATEYAWFVWHPAGTLHDPTITILNLTPKKERQNHED